MSMPRLMVQANMFFSSHLSYLLLFALVATVQSDKNSCHTDGTCKVIKGSKCALPVTLCHPSTPSKDIYRYGGSAQAYKPDQPYKTQICDPETYAEASRHRVASWPYSISTRKSPPRVQNQTQAVELQLSNR